MQHRKELTPQERFVSAGVGTCITSLVVTPLDVVKVRMQAQAPLAASAATASAPVNAAIQRAMAMAPFEPPFMAQCHCGDFVFCETTLEMCTVSEAHVGVAQQPQFRLNGTLDGIRKIVHYEGVTALWRGLSASLAMAIPSTAIYFVGYDMLKASLESQQDRTLSAEYAPLIAGGSARAVAATALAPAELLKTRLFSTNGKGTRGHLRAAIAGVRKLVEANGATVLWRGISPTLWRDVPFSGIYFLGYESIRKSLHPINGARPLSASEDFASAFLAGSVSGAFAAAITTPFDVAKTRQQINSSAASESVVTSMRNIFTESGWQGLFRGFGPRIVRTAPACAIMISSYEMGKRYFAMTPLFASSEQQHQHLH